MLPPSVEHRNNGKGWVVHADGNDEDERIPVSPDSLFPSPQPNNEWIEFILGQRQPSYRYAIGTPQVPSVRALRVH
jgi:hypothetical protein